VTCKNNVAMVGSDPLSYGPLELHAGPRFSDGGPARLAPETNDRIFFTWDSPNLADQTVFVVEHRCGPMVTLPCTGQAYAAAQGKFVFCLVDNAFSTYEVPRDAAAYSHLADIDQLSPPDHGRYFMFSLDRAVHVMN